RSQKTGLRYLSTRKAGGASPCGFYYFTTNTGSLRTLCLWVKPTEKNYGCQLEKGININHRVTKYTKILCAPRAVVVKGDRLALIMARKSYNQICHNNCNRCV